MLSGNLSDPSASLEALIRTAALHRVCAAFNRTLQLPHPRLNRSALEAALAELGVEPLIEQETAAVRAHFATPDSWVYR